MNPLEVDQALYHFSMCVILLKLFFYFLLFYFLLKCKI